MSKYKNTKLIKTSTALLLIFLSIILLSTLIFVSVKRSSSSVQVSLKNDSWSEYTPKCKALADNLKIFMPSTWNVSDDLPIYDGPYNNPPKSQADKDFNNLVSQCMIQIGFGIKPVYSQASDQGQGDYGIIWIRSQNVEVPSDLNVFQLALKNNPYYPESSKIYYYPHAQSNYMQTINGQTFLVNDGDLSWVTISNHRYVIDISLQIIHPEYYSNQLNEYLKNTVKEVVQKLVIK